MTLGKAQNIHFVGIGGIGMSGIAEVLLNLGFSVSGSDLETSPLTEHLASLGAVIHEGHAKEHIGGCDVVVVSSAISADNPEVAAARELSIPVIPRTEMLAELMRMRTGVAVAGAHGKTTTTSLAAVVLDAAGLDPTIVVGGRVRGLKANARLGAGKFLVAEADESDGNFVRLSPVFALITNIDEEHLDFYGGLEKIHDAFVTFANRVPFNGAVICCVDDPQVRVVMPRIERRIVTYGFGPEAHVRGTGVKPVGACMEFELNIGGTRMGRLTLGQPGRHYVLNALAVCALAEEIGIGFEHLQAAFSSFEGVGRRFEIKGEAGGVLFVDDYGHHPSEIAATIQAAREHYRRRLVVVFQPHRYTRTRDLQDRFDRCFEGADELFITRIYAAGERPIPGISGELVYRAARKGGMKNINYLPEWEDLRSAVGADLEANDLLLTLGAGDIWKLGEELLAERGPVKDR